MSPSHSEKYFFLRPLTSLLDAKIEFVVYGPDALTFVHRASPYGFWPSLQHVLLTQHDVSLAGAILARDHGYEIFHKPPFPVSCTNWQVDLFRPSDGQSFIALRHPDPDFPGFKHVFLHASSTFHFDLDDPGRSFTDPDPPHPSVAAIRYPTEIAFIDSLIDTMYEPPVIPRPFSQPPWEHWLESLLESSVCEYPNEWESEEMDVEFDEENWRYGQRFWGEGTICGREYVINMVKEENRSYLKYMLQSVAELLAGEDGIEWEEMVKIHADIRAARIEKQTAPAPVDSCHHIPALVAPPPSISVVSLNNTT